MYTRLVVRTLSVFLQIDYLAVQRGESERKRHKEAKPYAKKDDGTTGREI